MTGLTSTLVAIADRCAAARHQHQHQGDAPEPLTRTAWLTVICATAGRVNCGTCWAAPGTPCTATDATGSTIRGYHAARFTRAHRRGLISGHELDALTLGELPGSIVWDAPLTSTARIPAAGIIAHQTRPVPPQRTQTRHPEVDPVTSKDERRAALSAMTKPRLIGMCAAGIRRPDGGLSVIEGGAGNPLHTWSKDDLIATIMSVEYPPEVPGA